MQGKFTENRSDTSCRTQQVEPCFTVTVPQFLAVTVTDSRSLGTDFVFTNGFGVTYCTCVRRFATEDFSTKFHAKFNKVTEIVPNKTLKETTVTTKPRGSQTPRAREHT